MNSISIEKESDKFFWHGYVDFYQPFLQSRQIKSIAEVGVFKGNSIRWMLEQWPTARIIGADILPIQESWPIDSRVTYHQLDQGDVDQIDAFFKSDKFDLVIEDGSHHPLHQLISLLIGLESVTSNGLYILEDIHTSHPHSHYHKDFVGSSGVVGNSLSILMAIDHCRRIKKTIDQSVAEKIARDSLVNHEQIMFLDSLIDSIHIYKRTHLPDSCWQCGTSDYNFSHYKCSCGAELYNDTDSMTCVIVRK